MAVESESGLHGSRLGDDGHGNMSGNNVAWMLEKMPA